MKGLWLVTARELRERSRTRGFLISSLITLIVIAAAIVIPSVIGGDADVHKIGVVGEGNAAILEAASEFARAEVADDPDRDPDTFEPVQFPSRDAAATALGAGEIEVVLLDGSTALIASEGFGGAPLVDTLQEAAGAVRLQELVAANEEVVSLIEILSNDPLDVTTIAGEDSAAAERGTVAYGGLILMYIAVLSYGNAALTGVTEEKSNRVVEVLLTTLRPWQLLGGKVLGIGLLGLAQFAATVTVAFVALKATNALDLPDLDASTVTVLVLWFVLGFAVFSVLYAAAGALASRPEEAQSASLPMTMIAVIAFFLSFAVLGDPDSTISRVTTFIPFTAPFVVPIRSSLGALTWLEHVVAVAVTVAAIVLLVRVAARIYAGGLLRIGRRVRLREAWRGANS
jgi:ABC-2 type transport system permease protein